MAFAADSPAPGGNALRPMEQFARREKASHSMSLVSFKKQEMPTAGNCCVSWLSRTDLRLHDRPQSVDQIRIKRLVFLPPHRHIAAQLRKAEVSPRARNGIHSY